MELTDSDQKWLLEKYPGLTVSRKDGIQVVSGEFRFSAVYQDITIDDTYEVRIELRSSQYSDLPKVYETGSRIQKVSKARKIPLADLHAYEDGSVCLCVKLAEPSYFPDGFSFQIFIEDLVLPYFYAQSFFEESNHWPWNTYSHGILGWFEWYFEQEEISEAITNDFIEKVRSTKSWDLIRPILSSKGTIKGHRKCICGSGNRYRNCHQKVFMGIWRLQRDMKHFRILI